MASGVNLSALAAYTDQVSFDIIKQAVALPKIADPAYSKILKGDKSGTVALPLMRNTLFVTPSSAGFPTGGTFSVGQQTMAINSCQVKAIFSVEDFRNFFTSAYYNTASGQVEAIPFENVLQDLYEEQIELYLEATVFNGDAVGAPNVVGLVAQTTYGGVGSTSVGGSILYPTWSTGNTGPTAGSGNLSACWVATPGVTANALTQITAMINSIPAAVYQKDLVLYCSIPMFQNFIFAGVQANFFHYDFGSRGAGAPVGEQEMIYPGTKVKVVPFAGLGTSCHAFIAAPEYVMYAVGLSPDIDLAKMFYDQYNDEVKFMAKFRVGTVIAFPEYVVTNNL